jgi:hypothetical protein
VHSAQTSSSSHQTEIIKAIDRSLMNGSKTYAEVINSYSSKKSHKEFLRELAKSLSDPDFDYTGLVKEGAIADWQIKALSKGIVENAYVKKIWGAKVVEKFFATFRSCHEKNQHIQEALSFSERYINESLKSKKTKLEEMNTLADPWIDVAEHSVLTKSKVLKAKQLITLHSFFLLMDSKIAIRHVSFSEQALDELKSGTNGDALCISDGIASFVYHLFEDNCFADKQINDYLDDKAKGEFEKLIGECEKDLSSIRSIYELVYKNLKKIVTALSEPEQELLLGKYEEALRAFLYKSTFCLDNPIPLRSIGWKRAWEKGLSQTSSYLIIQKLGNFLSPYDQKKYYNIGKMGREKISKKDLKDMIAPPSMQDMEGFQKDFQDVTQQVIAVQESCIDRVLTSIRAFAESANKTDDL